MLRKLVLEPLTGRRTWMRQAVRGMLVLCALGGLVACTVQPSETKRASGDVTVRLPVVGANGVESLNEVVLRGIHDLSEVKGDYAQFTFAPKVTSTGLKGDSPRAHFLVAEGIFVPTDETTQHLAAVYAQLQTLFLLDQKAGAGDLLKWPRSVGISVRVRDEAKGGFTTDNAFYDGESDALLVVPYKNGRLPLAMNPGVLAHEHFHALFYRLVSGPLLSEKVISQRLHPSAHGEDELLEYFGKDDSEKTVRSGPVKNAGDETPLDEATFRRLYHTVMLKAVNEGLADVWGWIYTGDTEFLGRSLPNEARGRTLRLSEEASRRARLMERGLLEGIVRRFGSGNSAVQEGAFNQFSYRPGSELARAFRHILLGGKSFLSDETAVREAAARRIVKALPKIAEEIRSRGNDLSSFSRILRVLLEAEPLNAEQTLEAKRWLVNE